MGMMMADDDPLALYVHWPFCVSKCPYCDFNSHVRASVDQQAWRDALLADLAHEARALPGRRLASIFFGGGTPSLMPPETVAAVIDAATRAWTPVDDVEITLEANPSSVEAARFGDLAAAGVNRVSLGLQALDDAALRFLGRAHDVVEGLAALEVAQARFARVSFDLIYARPDQSLAAWEAELRRALAFGTEHLSLYQLTIELGTRFATEAAAGRLTIPDGDAAADLFEATRAMTAAAGIPAYEVSNHARAGAESRHNLVYWRYTDYAGIGPGAHGRRGGMATARHRKPENWLAAVARNAHGLQSEEALPPQARASEALLMGLRLREGVDLGRIARLTGLPPAALVDDGAIAALPGLIARDGDRLRVTEAGMLLLDAILPRVVRADEMVAA
jgi:putative oxygen-independent coproporphyrinogen III oxidase